MRCDRSTLMGKIRKFAKFFYFKIMRTSGSPEYIARGVAAGIFISFFMPNMFQTIPALLLAFLVRGAKIPAMLATWLSNWGTAVVIYPIQCYVGSLLIFSPMSYREVAENVKQAFHGMKEMDFEQFRQLGQELTVAFLAGGLLFGIAAAIPCYFLTLKLVREFQERRKARKKNKKDKNITTISKEDE